MNKWLDKFRDDKSKSGEKHWLDKFADDVKKKMPARQPPVTDERPQSIMIFAALMSVSLVLGLTATAIAFPKLTAIATPVEILLPDILVIAIVAALVYLIAGMRQQWAVWLLGAFCFVRFFLYVPTFLHINIVTVRLLTVAYFILQAAAFFFVFDGMSRNWLKKNKTK